MKERIEYENFLRGNVSLAVDFDGTITTDPTGIGPLIPRPHAIRVLKKLYNKGVKLILWTCRAGKDLEEALEFLKNHGVLHVFKAINKQLPEVEKLFAPDIAEKVGANFYLDDKNLFAPEVNWLEVEKFFDEYLSNKGEKEMSEELKKNDAEWEQMIKDEWDDWVERVVQVFRDVQGDKEIFDLDEIYRGFIPFYWALPYTKKDGDVRRDNVLMCYIFWKLAGIQYAKEGAYGSSYAKRGELEVFFNVSRKFDRLENIMLNGSKDEVGESKLDTIGDLANYGLLWLVYLLRTKPKEVMKFLKDK